MWDRLAASDPGLLRLSAGLRTVIAIALTLAVLAALRVSVPQLVAGVAAVLSTFAVREKQRSQQAVTLALGLPVALASVSLGALLNQRVVAGDLFFVVLIFGAVYGRRFGDRGTALGLIGFEVYFLSLFARATVSALPALYGVICVAFACSALTRFVLPQAPAGTLDRLRRAFRARLAQLIAVQTKLLDAGPDEVEKVAPSASRTSNTIRWASCSTAACLAPRPRRRARVCSAPKCNRPPWTTTSSPSRTRERSRASVAAARSGKAEVRSAPLRDCR